MIKKLYKRRKQIVVMFSRQSTHSLQVLIQNSGKQNPPTVKPNPRDKGGK